MFPAGRQLCARSRKMRMAPPLSRHLHPSPYLYPMQRRKVQKTGGGSFSFVLPKDWALSHHADREIVIMGHATGALTIYGLDHEQAFTATVDVSEKSRKELLNELISLYSLGVDEIRVEGKFGSTTKKDIRAIMRFLMGFEIVSENHQAIVLKSVLSDQALSFEQCLLSMETNARSMFLDAVEAFFSGDKEMGADVIERDVDVDRLYHLVIRNHQSLLQDKMQESLESRSLLESSAYEYIAAQIERVADRAVNIAKLSLEEQTLPIDEKTTQTIRRLSNEIIKLFAGSMDQKLDNKRIVGLELEVEPLVQKISRAELQFMQKPSQEGLLFLVNLQRTVAYIQNILEKRFQMTFFKKEPTA